MKKILITILVLSSVAAFAKKRTIRDNTCNIYLPETADLAWGEWKEDLIEKGYNPIEFLVSEETIKAIPEQALIGALNLQYGANSSFGKRSYCTIEMSVQRILNKEKMIISTLFNKSETQKRMTIFNTKIKCNRAENRIQRKIPNCEVI